MWPFDRKPRPRLPECPYCGYEVRPVELVTIRCGANEETNRSER